METKANTWNLHIFCLSPNFNYSFVSIKIQKFVFKIKYDILSKYSIEKY